jgi:ankyrin repeat protein
VEKPAQEVDRTSREKWIKSKYLTKEFLAPSDDDGDECSRKLYEGVKCGDIIAVAKALAHGADVDWKNEQDNGRTALHACAIAPRPGGGASWHGIEIAEILLQNGAKMSELDHSLHNVLDCAVVGNAEREMVEYLASKLE